VGDSLVTLWWLVLIRGIAAILFGLAAVLFSRATLAVLFILFGALLVVDGIALVIGAFLRRRDDERWWMGLVQAAVAFGIAALFFMLPESFAKTVLWLFGILLVVAGIVQVVQGIQLRKQIEGEWLLILGGVLWAVIGIAFMAQPLYAGVAFVWAVGIWAVVSGVMSIVLAFRIRSAAKDSAGGGPAAMA
jgi:uncharacterized membrane protein HdeD (DUF308 family)